MSDTNAQKQSNKKVSTAKSIQEKAIKDINSNEMKYYRFGLLPTDANVIKSFKTKYNITIVDRGCVMNNDEMVYNEFIAGEFSNRFRKNIEKELDNLATTYKK